LRWARRAFLFETAADGKVTEYPDGIAAELGLYDGLLSGLAPGEPPVEYGVVEYRYGLAHPTEYRYLVDMYGHVAHGPKRYTASAFIAATLGPMGRAGEVVAYDGPATGRWSYNSSVSYWSLPGAPASPMVTWETWAVAEEIDPETWPLFEG
jgi:hypothetical protein